MLPQNRQKYPKYAIPGINIPYMFSELIKRHKLAIAFLGDITVFLLSIIIVLRKNVKCIKTSLDSRLNTAPRTQKGL